MGRVWTCLILLCTGASLIDGKAPEVGMAMLESGRQAVTLLITLLATMPLWSGLMQVLVATGDVHRIGRICRRLLKPLFPGVEDDEAWNAISMNLSANLMGLGNAATPAGIEAAKKLSGLGCGGLRALAMLLVLDNASMQLIPTTVIALRHAAGARDPADIWGMTLLISGITMIAAASIMRVIQGGGGKHECNDKRRHCSGCGGHPA